MSGFRELQKIYEDVWTTGPNRSRFVTGKDSDISVSTFPGGLPGQGPNMGLNSYSLGIPTEEEDTIDKPVSKSAVLGKLKELKQECIDNDMLYAVHQLGKLQEFIQSL